MTKERSVLRARLTVLCAVLFFAGLAIGAYLITVAGGNPRQLLSVPVLSRGIVATIIAMIVATVIIGRWMQPMRRLRETVRRVMEGDLDARAAIASGDDFEQIGTSIDQMLSQQNSSTQLESEREQIYRSLHVLLQAVSEMSARNLSARAPVREDITGPIAAAINMMAEETASVLRNVTNVATNVAETSNLIKSQSDQIVMLARAERENLEECAHDLDIAVDTHSHIARMASGCAEAGEKALRATRVARISVQNNVAGVQSIRETLADTERRVRLLVERCQEIAGAINLISHIAERTHILALNASMHAAAVGDAGRSFSAVADEVQRLAENARDMANQIQGVVKNVQTDTNETMTSLQALIAHVHTGSELVDRSHHDIERTEEATLSLVEMVQKISAAATTQQQISAAIRQRTATMLEHVSRTGAFLLGQAEHTDNLAEHALTLVETVSEFHLADEANDAAKSP